MPRGYLLMPQEAVKIIIVCVSGLMFSTAVLAEHAPLSVMQAKTAGRCTTIEEAFVGFGEQSTKADALRRLDVAIAALRKYRDRYAAAKESKRRASCSVYIKTLNEYTCTAQAVLCR